MSALEAHPLADMFPMMQGIEFEALRDDIRTNGLFDAIWLYQGKILDGRNRYKACQEAGVGIATVNFEPETHGDPTDWVIAKNLMRRHLNESQRAMVAAKLATLKDGQRSDQVQGTSIGGAAALLSVSSKSVERAKTVQEKAAPELRAAVEQGHIAVSIAAKAAALPAADQKAIAEKATAGDANAARTHVKQQARAQREQHLGLRQVALPDKQYGVIVADPEWNFEVWSEKGKDRAAENHYPVSDMIDIKARDVASISADDCVLFLWATAPMMPQALDVMTAWGFEYKSQFVWGKNRAGTGYWNRNTHELLLIGTRGNIPAPAMGTQYHSLINAPIAEHSAKPAIFLEIIENYFPTLPKIELNRRGPARDGWDAWGNEVAPQPTTTTIGKSFSNRPQSDWPLESKTPPAETEGVGLGQR